MSVKQLLLILSFVALLIIPARAEVLEREWSGSNGTIQTTPTAVTATNPGGPVVNYTQPKVQQLAPAQTATTPQTKTIKTTAKKKKRTRRKAKSRKRRARKSRKRRRAAKKPAKVTEEVWWEKTGNPAVFAFRDCLTEHAKRYEKLAGDVSAYAHVTQAMDAACRDEFDTMARTIAARFGEDGFRKVAGELIQTTFLPAAAPPTQ